MANDIDRILEHEWTKEGVEHFIAHCWDRQALMAALIGFAREYMTHRILMRLRKGAFHPFVLQGWPAHVDEEAKTPRLRKLQLPAATTPRVKKALAEGHPLAAPPAEFGLQRVLQFLGEEIDEEILCEPVTVGPSTEWVLIGKPIRIDPNSHSFSSDAITLKFWELEEVCDQVGAQYQRIRRLGKRDKLPPVDERIPPLTKPPSDDDVPDNVDNDDELAFGMSAGFEPVEVNKRTQQRINADAGGFSAERFLAGEDAFSGKARPSTGDFPAVEQDNSNVSEETEISDLYDAPEEEDVGVTTGVFKLSVDPRSMAEVNYGQSSHTDEAPALADIEHTNALQLDTSVLSEAKKAYHRTLEREEKQRQARVERERQAEAQPPRRPADRPITAEEKARVRKAIALMDSSNRDQAFKAARYVASFGERAVKTLGRLFPGRLFVDRYQFQTRNLPPVEQHSPVLYALAALGEPGLKVTRHYIDDASIDLRFYATYLYTRLPAEDDVERIFERLFDRDRQTRQIAQRVIAGLRDVRAFEYMVLEPLRRELADPKDEFRQSIAIETLGYCRDIPSIEPLIDVLKFKSGRTAQLAHKALRRITLQDLSASASSWDQWWKNQRPDYSDQWLVAALDSSADEIRRIAWQELNQLDDVDIDYNPNYPSHLRQQAQQDLAVWLGVKQF
jgi:hypothetical protein